MTGKRNRTEQSLRGKAEAQLRDIAEKTLTGDLSDLDIVELVHEIQVHQIELEIQNEELRRMQGELLASRQRFADLFHQAPVGYLVLDQNGLVKDVNDTFCRMTDHIASKIKSRSVFELISEKDRGWFMARYKALYKKPEQKNMELELLTAGGDVLPVSLDAVSYVLQEPDSLDDGVPCLLLTVSDITERKLTENALQAQTDLLTTVFESSPNILMLVDANARVEKINRTGSEFAGSPQEKLTGLLAGEVFQCINSFDGKGCGRNVECGDCPVRTRMTRSLNEGVTILNEEGRLTIRRDAQEIPLDFLISTVPVTIAGATKVLITIVDINDKKRVEEHMRYQAYLLENVSDAIISTDSNFVIQSWNRAAKELYGWDKNEVLGKTVEDVLKSEFQEPLKQVLDNFYKESSWRGEVTQYRKDGAPISVLSSVRLVQNEKGELLRTIATNRDITERKQVEEALRQSEMQNRTILRTAMDGFWLIDPATSRILDVNDSYCEMSGYTRDEVLQMSIADFEVIESPDEVQEHSRKVLALGRDRFESAHRRKDGSIFQVEVSVQHLKDDDSRTFAFIHDITERKRAENDLSVALAKYKTLFNTIPVGVTISDEAGNILESNSIAEKLLGFSPKELNPRSIKDIKWHIMRTDGTPMPADEYASVRALKEKRLVNSVEMGIVKSEDETIWISVIADLLPLNGYGVITAYNEITERKRTEEKLKGLLQEKEILLAEVHHRVKNNMQIIASLLGLQAREITDERFLAAFEESRNRIKSMALVHEQLYRAREYAQIEFGTYIDQLTVTLFNMYQVEPDQVQLQLDARDIYLELDRAIPCGLLLNELITNSLKYAFPHGRKGKLWIKLITEQDFMVLVVGDNGVGVPASFDFETTHSLGLQLVHLLVVHDLQGSITLERNKGTQFRIKFPIQPKNKG